MESTDGAWRLTEAFLGIDRKRCGLVEVGRWGEPQNDGKRSTAKARWLRQQEGQIGQETVNQPIVGLSRLEMAAGLGPRALALGYRIHLFLWVSTWADEKQLSWPGLSRWPNHCLVRRS